jgi:hypothetical protein
VKEYDNVCRINTELKAQNNIFNNEKNQLTSEIFLIKSYNDQYANENLKLKSNITNLTIQLNDAKYFFFSYLI